MFLSKFKLKDSEPCPCGSNKSFQECCKGKEPRIIKPSKKPAEVQIMEKMRASMKKCCMHPDKEKCKGPIKGAHALQNNKIISLLAGSERHVYMLNTKKQPLLIPLDNGEVVPLVELSKESANDATTETCFCDYHDNIAFAIIEKGAPDFDETSEAMKFVYAYKAFIFEYYKQRIAFDIFQSNFRENPIVFQSPEMIGMYRMLQLKMQEFEPVKQHFDSQILGNKLEGVSTCAVRIPEQIKFAGYAYIAPDYDINGKRIKHTIKGIMHRIAITIFPETTQSWLLLSCLESEKHIYEKLFYQLETASVDKLKFYINMVLPLYSENMVLSPLLWNAWNEDIQMAYTYYANLHGPEAMSMGMGIGFGLKNAARDKTGKAYEQAPKINLFL
ncbi:TPA: SEC-C metal-binding domain-containing protein [Bacillus paranthracis]